MEQAAIEKQIDPRGGSIRQHSSQAGTEPTGQIMQSSVKDPRGPRLVQENAADVTQGNGEAAGTAHPPAKQSAVDDAYDPTSHDRQSYDHKQSTYQAPPDSGTVHPGLANLPAHSTFPQVQDQKPKLESSPPSGNIMPSGNSNAGSKIFVGGLSWETDETSLRRYFETYGEVLDCVIMRDRHTGHPRGFGFVTFADDAVAGRAASRRHDLDGRQVEAKRAVPRNEFHGTGTAGSGSMGGGGYGLSRGSGGGGHGGRYGGDGGGSGYGSTGSGGSAANIRSHHTTKCKVFVGGLPSSCGVDEFRSYFQTFGDVVDAQVMIDHNTGNSRGFGFVTFATEDTVEQVVGPGKSNTRHEIMGKNVEVKRAEPKGASTDRRNRDSYNASGGGGGGMRGSGAGNSSNIGANTDAGSNAATAAAAAYYSNYPGASLAEQYGAYYNNPQWQQYYAAMGYNFNAYPQGYNPYSYLQAYMSNVANGSSQAADGSATAATGTGPDSTVYDGATSGGMGSMGRYGSDMGSSGMASGNGGLNASSGGGSGTAAGTGGRRSSRREERYHPYR